MANGIPNTFIEKHDIFVPQELREHDYGAKFFDVDGAWQITEEAQPFSNMELNVTPADELISSIQDIIRDKKQEMETDGTTEPDNEY